MLELTLCTNFGTDLRNSDVASQEPFKKSMSAPANVSVVMGAMPTAYPDVILRTCLPDGLRWRRVGGCGFCLGAEKT